jgi:hypothetical protein
MTLRVVVGRKIQFQQVCAGSRHQLSQQCREMRARLYTVGPCRDLRRRDVHEAYGVSPDGDFLFALAVLLIVVSLLLL